MTVRTTWASWTIAQAHWYAPVRIGPLRMWYDSTHSAVRVKHGSDPSSEGDGSVLMEG